MENPHRFAALVPISGAAPAPYAGWLGDLPIWVFHGDRDSLIPVSESIRIVQAIRQKGGIARFTRYPEAEHVGFTQVFVDC